jgi:signal transduction histidine kinase
MIRKFLGDWTVKSSNELNSEDENHHSLLLIPIISTNDVVGTIVLSRPIAKSPFTAKNLSEVEFFVTFIGRYLHLILTQSNLLDIQSFIVSFMLYETHPPLVSIRGYSELLLSDPKYGGLNDQQLDSVRGIQKYHKLLKHIIGTSYYLSRLETDDVRVGNERCDISEIVTKGYKQLKPNFEDKKQIVHQSFEKNIFAQGDEARIEYVAEAFMKNACSYSPDGRDIDVSVESNENFVRVSVTDHGIGLTDEEKRHLFQRFYRSDRAEVREYSGVGLELFIAKRYIEKMGGQIGAEGSPDQGSTFWFTLPIAKE